jgi:uncharacterized membrane protein YfcA
MAVFAVAIGIITGVVSGLIGLGGGILIVPALVYVFKMSQHEAQGTSLATLLLPIGLLGFREYYRQGRVDLRVAALLAAGFFVGAYVGGRWAQLISEIALRRVFAATLVIIAIRMWFET